jgi:hypothetical protein
VWLSDCDSLGALEERENVNKCGKLSSKKALFRHFQHKNSKTGFSFNSLEKKTTKISHTRSFLFAPRALIWQSDFFFDRWCRGSWICTLGEK